MILSMVDLLKVAKKNNFAVPAFNICSYDMLKAIMEECEDENAPVILEIHPDEIEYLGNNFVAAVREYALRTKLPVVIHCDHGATLSDAVRAIRNGYTSVMIDASMHPYEENVRITKQVVEIAHCVGVSVEAEVGTIGNNRVEGGTSAYIYTDVDQACDFVDRTGCDTLAVAIGTAHGLYPKDMVPKLNIPLLEELESRIHIPFVLHGGSGNPDDEVSEATKHGVCKVNLSSDLKSAFFKALRKYLNTHDEWEPNVIYPPCNDALKNVVKHKIGVLNDNEKAQLYY